MSLYPHPFDDAVSKRMRANRRRDSRAELAVRSALHRAGMRFFVDRPLRLTDRIVRPDITFSRTKVAIFIDGCFWHGCPEHGTAPRRNVQYWAPKLRRNIERDRAVDEDLRRAGWYVARFWEHQSSSEIARIVEGVVASRRAEPPPSD